MGFPLSTLTLARLEAATRTLVSPLAMPDVEVWRDEAMRTVCDVVGADSATFYLPGDDRMIAYTGMDPHFGELIQVFTGGIWSETGDSPDPVMPFFYQAIVERNLGVWNMHTADHLLGGGGAAWQSMFYQEVLRHVRAGDTHALFVPRPEGSSMITTHTFHREPDPTDHLPVLRVLLPAFKAGLEAFHRLHAQRAALDAVDEPLAAFDADGTETYRNDALVRLLQAEPEAGLVEAHLTALLRQVRPLGFARRGESAAGAPVRVEVRTARARYTLRATLLPAGTLAHDGALLITVTADGGAPALPTADDLRHQHGLSRREAEVALLVAQGLSNEGIAARLFVSAHTVRHHVEAVMAKLALTGRGREAVAPRLLGAEVT